MTTVKDNNVKMKFHPKLIGLGSSDWSLLLVSNKTHEPRMRTWDWRLFTWLSLLCRNCRRQKRSSSSAVAVSSLIKENMLKVLT